MIWEEYGPTQLEVRLTGCFYITDRNSSDSWYQYNTIDRIRSSMLQTMTFCKIDDGNALLCLCRSYTCKLLQSGSHCWSRDISSTGAVTKSRQSPNWIKLCLVNNYTNHLAIVQLTFFISYTSYNITGIGVIQVTRKRTKRVHHRKSSSK